MDVDASQYASIAMEMLQGGHWLQVQYHHANYLDKPPLLFWSSALSFAAFGLHPWAYKLPSLIAMMAGVYATYRFTLLYYAKSTARNAAFILAASIGAVLMSNDVRTDALLLGATACAVWQLAEHLESGRLLPLLLGALFTGLALLAKGPIGMVMPAFAVGTHIALRRDWRALWRWQWLLGLLIVAIYRSRANVLGNLSAIWQFRALFLLLGTELRPDHRLERVEEQHFRFHLPAHLSLGVSPMAAATGRSAVGPRPRSCA